VDCQQKIIYKTNEKRKINGKKTYLLQNKKLNRFKFSFPFVSILKQVPPLAQGDGCNNTSPWHIQHNKPRATMR
jgi:hypothetical protein